MMYKLLIVDDEPIEREAIKYFIQQAELNIEMIDEAANGIQAIAKALELLPDIIIMDIKMPGKDGLEAAREIRLFSPGTKIIFLTAFSEFDYAQKAIKVKAEDFIIKPANKDNLIGLLTRLIANLEAEEASKSFFQSQISYSRGDAGYGHRKENLGYVGYPFEAEKKLCENIIKCDEIESDHHAKTLMDWIIKYSGCPNQIIEKVNVLLTIIDQNVMKELNLDTPFHKSRLDDLQKLHSSKEITLFVFTMLHEIIGWINKTKSTPLAQLIDKVCCHIDQNYHKNLKLDELCDMVGFSKFYFSRAFKQYKNMNLVDYITYRRIERAKQLLKDPRMSIKEVSAIVGYCDANYFASVFKKCDGISPTEYRNLYCR